MNAMVKRLGFWVGLLALCGAASCAQGAPAIPDPDPEHPLEAPPPFVAPKCGNGVPDMGELCDCMMGVTSPCLVMGKTCDMVMNGTTGPLLCNPATCTFNLDMCKGPGGVGGAGGASH